MMLAEHNQSTDAEPREAVMLSVVIPALNEEDGIANIIRRVQQAAPALREAGVEDVETIVVDDGSHDQTAEIAASFAGVRVVRHEVNRGYGAAIKNGFLHARGDLLAFLDADGTYPPERFADLCRHALEDRADIVVGSRRSGADSQMPLVRRAGNLIWSNLVSLFGSQRVDDPASGMRVVRRSALSQLYPLPDGLNFTPVMSTRSVHEGLKVVEVPISYRERVGRSKLSVVRDGTRFLSTIVWTTLEYNPVRVLGLVGIATLAIAAATAFAVVGLRLSGTTHLGTWGAFAVFAAMILGIAGVSIFSLGATFNYLVSLFHHRPIRQGLLGRPIFDPPIDRHFGWLGGGVGIGGIVLAGATVALASSEGWDIARLWLWLLASGLFILVGLQLVISWMLMRVLEGLSERGARIEEDLAPAKVAG